MSRKSKADEFVDEAYNIHVTGRHMHVTEAMKDYAIEKISKIERFSARIIDVVVIMDIQREEHRVDIVMKVDNIKIKSHAVTTDMYASVDIAADKIRTQLLKYKEKLKDHQMRKISMVDVNVNLLGPVDEFLQDLNTQIDDENKRRDSLRYQAPKVVSKKTIPLKTLTLGEAVMRLDLSNDSFLVYRSEEDRRLKVLYRCSDGNYGVIEPEV